MPNLSAGPLRKIAKDVVQQVTEDSLQPSEQDELVTSLLRQWLTYNGHAALLTWEGQTWIVLDREEKETTRVGLNQVAGSSVARLMARWDVEEELLPEILHRLNVSQSAEFPNRQQQRLRFWVSPIERTVHIEQLTNTLPD
jgi:hypothetical protein